MRYDTANDDYKINDHFEMRPISESNQNDSTTVIPSLNTFLYQTTENIQVVQPVLNLDQENLLHDPSVIISLRQESDKNENIELSKSTSKIPTTSFTDTIQPICLKNIEEEYLTDFKFCFGTFTQKNVVNLAEYDRSNLKLWNIIEEVQFNELDETGILRNSVRGDYRFIGLDSCYIIFFNLFVIIKSANKFHQLL